MNKVLIIFISLIVWGVVATTYISGIQPIARKLIYKVALNDAGEALSSLEFGVSCEEAANIMKRHNWIDTLDCETLSLNLVSWYGLEGRVDLEPRTLIGSYSSSLTLVISGELYRVKFDFIKDALVAITYSPQIDNSQHVIQHFSENYGTAVDEVVYRYGWVGHDYVGIIEWSPGATVYVSQYTGTKGYRIHPELLVHTSH